MALFLAPCPLAMSSTSAPCVGVYLAPMVELYTVKLTHMPRGAQHTYAY